MNAKQIIRRALAHLVDGHVFPDVADQDVPLPQIVYHVAGGGMTVDLSGKPFDKYLARVQISVWHETDPGRSSLMQQVLRALVSPAVGAIPLGAPTEIFERETRLYGSRVDVSMWVEF